MTKLNAAQQWFTSTYLGGSGDDYGNGIAVDSSGNAYVTGSHKFYTLPHRESIPEHFRGWSKRRLCG